MKASTLTMIGLMAALGTAACSDKLVAPDGAAALISVQPTGGTVNVDPGATISLTLTHPMQMEVFAALHEGDGVDGPLVDGTWTWSTDRTQLTFTPDTPLQAQSEYTIHIGGGMRDADGDVVDLEEHRHDMGGEWATRQMVEDRMMGGRMMGGDDMMGPGWQHANGTFGMLFTFTTA